MLENIYIRNYLTKQLKNWLEGMWRWEEEGISLAAVKRSDFSIDQSFKFHSHILLLKATDADYYIAFLK